MYEQTENVLDPKSDLKVMRVYAFDNNANKGYTIRYYSEPGLFNKYLPAVHKMANSFEIKDIGIEDARSDSAAASLSVNDMPENTILTKMTFKQNENQVAKVFELYDLLDYTFVAGKNSEICPVQNCGFELEEMSLTTTEGYGLIGTMKVDIGNVKKILGIYSDFKPTEEREEQGQKIETVEGTFRIGKEPINEAEYEYNVNGTIVTDGNERILSLQGINCTGLSLTDGNKPSDCNY